MRACGTNSSSVLPAVRYYFQLLVASVVLLSSSLIGYFYWFSNLQHKLDVVTNHYHLETILYCTRIKEEITHILPAVASNQLAAEHSSGQNRPHTNHNNAIYLIEQHMQSISKIHETHAAASDQTAIFEPVIRKAHRQLARIKVEHQKTGGMEVKSGRALLDSFVLSIDQLRRLHSIARNEASSELNTLSASAANRMQTLFIVAMLLGILVVWKILRGVRHLVEVQGKTEAALRQSATVFENASEGVLITDIDIKIIAVNSAFTKITGYSEQDVLGKNPRILKSGGHDQTFYKAMWNALIESGEWQGEMSGRRKNGEMFPKWQTISAVRDPDGELTHYVSVFSDISHIKETESQLYHLAHHDSLTALPNRLLLSARLEHSLQHAHRKGTNVGVLFLDLDHFKRVNDSLGHAAGDHLLQLVAKRLLDSAREEDTVARLGGDELAVVLGSLHGTQHVARSARDVLDKLSEPFDIEGHEIFVSASIGISIYPRDGQDAPTLLKNADTAMYMAKNSGRSTYHFYSQDLSIKARKSLALEADLHRALEREELLLHFQPQVSLQSGCIVGVEALVRWQHPEIGLVSPGKFIPLAEENGLIETIGLWVLRCACKQAKTWQNEGLVPFRMAVNLSERQLRNSGIALEVRDILEKTGLDPCYLELELTESSVMKHAQQALTTLNMLRDLGVTIAIDDFGTGYSSLSYLKLFPVDRLKIDRSFIRDIPHDVNDVAIARTIVTLGHSLNLSVVAEGIETPAQRELLTSIGCDEMQGFLYCQPLTADELLPMLTTQTLSDCCNDSRRTGKTSVAMKG